MMFAPKRPDGRARWRVIFDMAAKIEPGDVLPYADLEAALETGDRRIVYRAVAVANRHLWAGEQRSLEVVPEVGYRMLHPHEHEAQATGFQRQGRRKLDNAVKVAMATDLAALPSEHARQRILQFTAGMMLMARAVDRHERQLARHDDLISELDERISRMEGRKKDDDDKADDDKG